MTSRILGIFSPFGRSGSVKLKVLKFPKFFRFGFTDKNLAKREQTASISVMSRRAGAEI